MKDTAQNQREGNTGRGGPEPDSLVEGWKLIECEVAGSTNLVAAELGAWSAVRAGRQTAGRGRFQRGWVSDEGGLWLSGVVPTDTAGRANHTLPLAAGLAVCQALQSLGVPSLRLRWPNDVLVNDRKLAGLLIDQLAPGRAVVGIGVNVSNQPETHDSSLKNQTARLADLIANPPSLHHLAVLVLRHLRRVVTELAGNNFQSLPAGVNKLWGPPRFVELDLDGERRRGLFCGVDAEGRLILQNEKGRAAHAPWQVRHLQETEPL